MRVCSTCSTISDEPLQRFCVSCGANLSLEAPTLQNHTPNGNPTTPDVDKGTHGLAVASLVCGGLSFLIVPFVLGPIGIALGGVAWRNGSALGKRGTVVSALGLCGGVLVGYVLGWY